MLDFAAITTDLAEWLTAQPLDELPPIWGLQLVDSDLRGPQRYADFQLAAVEGDVEKLDALARWADHLDTTVVVTAGELCVKAQVNGKTARGYGISLWGHLDQGAWRLLETEGYRFGAAPVEVPATALRDVAAYLGSTRGAGAGRGCGN